MKKPLKPLFLLFAFIIVASPLLAQTKAEKRAADRARIEKLIKSRNFIFEPTSVQPTSMPSRQLTYSYFLSVKKDTLACYLPYYGVAYSAPMDPAHGPLDFSASEFTYSSTPDKHGGTSILITFSDIAKPRSMNLSVSADGYATLYVTSNDRQPISFYGMVKESPIPRTRRTASR